GVGVRLLGGRDDGRRARRGIGGGTGVAAGERSRQQQRSVSETRRGHGAAWRGRATISRHSTADRGVRARGAARRSAVVGHPSLPSRYLRVERWLIIVSTNSLRY